MTFEETDAEVMDIVYAIVVGLGTMLLVVVIAFTIVILEMKGAFKAKGGCCQKKKKMGAIVINLTEFNEVVDILENGKIK
jgi:hypothetical protein